MLGPHLIMTSGTCQLTDGRNEFGMIRTESTPESLEMQVHRTKTGGCRAGDLQVQLREWSRRRRLTNAFVVMADNEIHAISDRLHRIPERR